LKDCFFIHAFFFSILQVLEFTLAEIACQAANPKIRRPDCNHSLNGAGLPAVKLFIRPQLELNSLGKFQKLHKADKFFVWRLM
jgi:hypothetical protein